MSVTLPAEVAGFIAKSSIPVTVAAPGAHDRVLLEANDSFCRLTGYERGEILGRDCRFLQGAETSRESRGAMRRFFEDPGAQQTRVAVVNYRRDGRPFVNLVFLSKLKDHGGAAAFLLASQFDVSHASEATARAYEGQLGAGVAELQNLIKMHKLGMETSLATLAASTHTIASAKLALAQIEARAT